MNILFVGRFFPPKLLETVIVDSKGKIGMSNHNFEKSIITGLSLHNNICLKCISIPGVYSFPTYNNKFYTKAEHFIYNKVEMFSVGFCNLKVLKVIWSIISFIIQLLKCINKYEGNRVDIIVNTPNSCLLYGIKIARLFSSKKITQTVIIPDIPSFVTSMNKHSSFKNFLLKFINKKVMIEASNSDGLVVLTKAMMEFIIKPVPYMVMEGIIDVHSMTVTETSVPLEKEIILYAGTLRRIFGVMNLVEAFRNIEVENVELWICGSGDSKEAIENIAKDDKRIIFYGLVDSMTALQMQHKATILINPRTSEGEYTKYSFPSKTMEYLFAGKSVIINRLPGIPEEYYEYVYTPYDETISSLTECISMVLNLSKEKRRIKAEKGRKFVIKEKNSLIQTGRILDMIKNYNVG